MKFSIALSVIVFVWCAPRARNVHVFFFGLVAYILLDVNSKINCFEVCWCHLLSGGREFVVFVGIHRLCGGRFVFLVVGEFGFFVVGDSASLWWGIRLIIIICKLNKN